MKKSEKKKKKKLGAYGTIKITLLTSASVFCILAITTTIATTIFHILHNLNIVHSGNYRTLMVIVYVLVCTLISFPLSIITFHRPAKKMRNLFNAMSEIANGNFSVRLTRKYKFDKMSMKTIRLFNNMASQLEGTQMLSRDFVSNFSHEFKTPIASINGFAKLLKSDELTEEEKNEYLDIIIQESERLSNLSNNILTLSKLEKQAILTNRIEFNLTEQIRQVVSSLYAKWSGKKVEIDFSSQEEYSLFGNRELLSHAWINLLDNAIKFSPENETIFIKISKETFEDNDDQIIVTFTNKGISASEDNLERFFDKFYQGEKSHSTEGNGLGLPMVKRIVELHDGSITAKATANNTVTFFISFPIK